MGLLDKLKFWKKEEPAGFELGKYPALEAGPALPGQPMPGGMPGMIPPSGLTEMPTEDFGPAPFPPAMRGQPSFAPAQPMAPPQAMPGADVSRDMQVVQAKLDTLKALLDSVISKLDRLERAQQPKEEEAVPLSVRRWR